MTLTCKNVEAIIYGYDRQTGDTGKNLVADMLKEMATAIGFNITLLKEDCNPNKAFCFQEEDVEIIRKIIMLSKSKEGKRLRCRDYEGAGFLCVVGAINAYKLLALHAGISKTQVNLELRKMHECTNQFVLRELIRFETNDYDIDLTEHFFAPNSNCQDDENMDEVDKQVFLEFILQNITERPSDIRGIYWFFVQEKEQIERILLMEEVEKIKKLSPECFNEWKDHLRRRIKLEQTLLDDDEYNRKVDELINILEGKGKLQDNRRLKNIEKKLQSIRDTHIQEIFEVDVESNNQSNSPNQYNYTADDEEKRYNLSQIQLKNAIKKYMQFKAYRSSVPITVENETILELSYKQRFGMSMFE